MVPEVVVGEVRELVPEHKGQTRLGFSYARLPVAQSDSRLGEHDVSIG